MGNKNIMSMILQEKRKWIHTEEQKPKQDQLVVMRLTNPNIVFNENDDSIYPSEDIKIGKYVPSSENPNDGEWVISHPFPKYDYSILSDYSKLKEGTVVSHWAVPEEGEVEGWFKRFNPIGTYKKLGIEVDDENEEDVYRALMHGAAFIYQAMSDMKDKDLERLYTILCDLQACIDKDARFINGQFESRINHSTFVLNANKEEVTENEYVNKSDTTDFE